MTLKPKLDFDTKLYRIEDNKIQEYFVISITFIKSIIHNDDKLPLIELSLSKINKTLKSYLRVANRMIDEYTKAFGRLLYKSKKDIEIQKQNWMINYGEQELNEY